MSFHIGIFRLYSSCVKIKIYTKIIELINYGHLTDTYRSILPELQAWGLKCIFPATYCEELKVFVGKGFGFNTAAGTQSLGSASVLTIARSAR